MALPPDIQDRIQRARQSGFTDAQIDADMRRKYGVGLNQPEPPHRSIVQKVGDFLGISKFGEGLGQAAFNATGGMKGVERSNQGLLDAQNKLLERFRGETNPEAKERMRRILEANSKQLGQTNYEDIATGGVSNKDFLLGAANTALNVAAAGTAGGEAAGAGIAGTTKIAPVSLRNRIIQAAITGGGFGATGAAQKDNAGAGDVLAGAGAGAATSAGLVGLLGLIGKAAGKLTSKAPEVIYKTSTQVPEKTDVATLINEGVTGNRSQLADKARALVIEAQKRIEANPAMQRTAPVDELLSYGPLQKLRETAERVGELGIVDDAIKKVLPNTVRVPENVPGALAGAQDALDQVMAQVDLSDPNQIAALAEKSKEFLNKTNAPSLLEWLKQKAAIDATSTPGVFADRSSSLGERGRNAVANSIRNTIAKEAPEVAGELGRQAPAQALIKELTRYANARSRQIPGSFGNLAQRTILTPAIGTRLARALSRAGGPARVLDKGVLNDQVRQFLKALLIAQSRHLHGE